MQVNYKINGSIVGDDEFSKRKQSHHKLMALCAEFDIDCEGNEWG